MRSVTLRQGYIVGIAGAPMTETVARGSNTGMSRPFGGSSALLLTIRLEVAVMVQQLERETCGMSDFMQRWICES